MNKISIFKSIISIFIISIFFASCDKDFNNIGSDIIDDNHFGFDLDTISSVVAFVQPTGVVQTNNLPLNQLGIYNNPVFGKTKANFVTQLSLPSASLNPRFDPDLKPVIESVILSVPYFSKKTATGANGDGTYTLDSISGNEPIKLTVFESGYQIQDFDPSTNAQDAQKYYNNQDNIFNANKIGDALYNNAKFFADKSEVIVKKRDNNAGFLSPVVIESRLSPRMQLELDTTYFRNKIFNASNDKFISNGSFKDYMKGLYFQVEGADGTTNGTLMKLNLSTITLMKLNFAAGNITITYKQYAGLIANTKNPILFDDDNNPDNADEIKYVLKTFVINLTGNSVNLIEQTNSNYYASAILNPNIVSGDKKLNLKGGAEGSVAVIDLFGKDLHGADGLTGSPNGKADELDIIKQKGWLINEANLVFYIDKTQMENTFEPNRLYLYDLKNHRPLIDYAIDVSSNPNTKLNKVIHGGIIIKENVTNGRGIKYKFRITNHIRNLVGKDSTNVPLGLAVTEAILITTNAKLKNTVTPSAIDRVPLSSVINPLGTVLYGSNYPFNDSDYNKRLKLEIYYTKLN